MSKEQKEAYGLKELYKALLEKAKGTKEMKMIKEDFEAFYCMVEETENPAFLKASQTYKN